MANNKEKPKHIIVFLILILIILFIIVPQQEFREKAKPQEKIIEGLPEVDQYDKQRKAMVETQLRSRDITDEKVLKAMETVPRHKFLSIYIDQAYGDHPVPIGYGQTISQPYIVALMTQALEVKPTDKILEIGTGSGYQAAILAELVNYIYTIEIIEPLATRASLTLANLDYKNVEVKHADGYYGWEEQAPFDAIIITAAVNHVPPPLIAQLKDNGKLILPLASSPGFQTLTMITKKGEELQAQYITGVRFVPLTGYALERGTTS